MNCCDQKSLTSALLAVHQRNNLQFSAFTEQVALKLENVVLATTFSAKLSLWVYKVPGDSYQGHQTV